MGNKVYNNECKLTNGGRVLIIESDSDGIKFIESIVNREDIDCISVTTIEEAKKVFEDLNSDIKAIIADVSFPDSDMLEVARSIHKESPDMPFLFSTPNLDPSINNLLWQHGIVYHKPLEEDFPAAIRRLVSCANDNECIISRVVGGRRKTDIQE